MKPRSYLFACLLVVLIAGGLALWRWNRTPVWRNPGKPMAERVANLVSLMTLRERTEQMCDNAPAIPRLGLPAYNYWNECLHGVARNTNTTATVFPQAIGLAAMWDTNLLYTIADTISDEARSMNRQYTETNHGNSAQFDGLSFWTPNINIFRDPRWGRGQETYGEDPFLTARTAVAFITGLQGNDPVYVKAMACAKHFAVHSGPELTRHSFDVHPSERDLYETYLPQFEAAVREAHVGAVMASYNAVNGVPAPCNSNLLSTILRDKWGFDGHVVSDCGAINDIYLPGSHNFVNDPNVSTGMSKAEALSIKAGCELGCWGGPTNIEAAVVMNLLSEADVNKAVGRVLMTRFRLGLFDPPSRVKYSQIPANAHDTPANDKLSLLAARESIVLLKNDGVLPLDRSKIKRIAVFGMNARSQNMLVGDYFGIPSRLVPIVNGIANAAGEKMDVKYTVGCSLVMPPGYNLDNANETAARAQAVDLARQSDVLIYVGGIGPDFENEFITYPQPIDGFAYGDRTKIELPATQTALLKELKATGKPLIFVNCSGSAVAMPWEAENVSAIVQAWYPGQEGGTAVGDVLFGDYNPGGRLPVTFYRSTDDLPEFTNYDMSNRTYRYFTGKPLWAFGYGLSYTTFNYQSAKIDKPEAAPADTVTVSVDVSNSGTRDGEEVVQVYYRHVDSAVPQPVKALCGFQRVSIPRGQSKTVSIKVPLKALRYWSTAKQDYVVEMGKYELLVGAASDEIRATLPLSVGK